MGKIWCWVGVVGVWSMGAVAAPDFDTVLPSVVHIKPESANKNDQGSGFLLDSRGYIVTSNHVLTGSKVRVTFSDRSWEDSETLLKDPKSDLALIKLPERAVQGRDALAWGLSGQVKLGQPLWAFGSPFGFQGTVTRGIVSATHRALNLVTYEDFIQTDVAINPGNSGGPLVNTAGQVVGVITAIQSSSGSNSGVSFAVSSRMAKFVTDQLIDKGKVVRGYVGLSVKEGKSQLGPHLEVTGVAADSPAAVAGIRSEDRIVNVLGQPVRTLGEIRREISFLQPGSSVTFTILRGTQERTLTFDVGELPVPQTSKRFEKLGMELAPITEALAKSYGHATVSPTGLLVTESFGSAASAGIRSGDVVLYLEDSSVESLNGVTAFVEGHTGNTVLVQVLKANQKKEYRILKTPSP